ncbi:MAG: ParB N-terminal domain-containing protein [Planctomycetes bacterium]|nr:ParB N-terminal domain-containing protein [Planctomycetota bacterium]
MGKEVSSREVTTKVPEELTERLRELSRAIYGDRAEIRVVDPRALRLLKKNARSMRKATFDQLTENLRRDGMLSSLPLCHPIAEKPLAEAADDELEVLSGNHRVKAAIKAGLTRILVLVIPHQDRQAKIAKQLSHNALVGEDDKQILAELWAELKDIEMRLYAGLDSELMEELDRIHFEGLTAVQPRTEKILLWFLPEEVEELDAILEEAAEAVAADETYAAPLAKYRDLFEALARVKELRNIKNTAVAFLWLIDRMKRTADNLTEEDAIDRSPAEEAGNAPKA